MNIRDLITNFLAYVRPINDFVGFFGYVLAATTYIQQRAIKKTHEETINAIVAASEQKMRLFESENLLKIRPQDVPISKLYGADSLNQSSIMNTTTRKNDQSISANIFDVTTNKIKKAAQRNKILIFLNSINHRNLFLFSVFAQCIWALCVIAMINMASVEHIYPTKHGSYREVIDNQNYYELWLVIWALTFFTGIITVIIVLIIGIIQTIRNHRWGWLISLIFFSGIGFFILSPIISIVYGLNGPTTRRARKIKLPNG